MQQTASKRRKGISVKDFDNEELWLEFKSMVVRKKMKIAQALEEAIRLWIEREKGRSEEIERETAKKSSNT